MKYKVKLTILSAVLVLTAAGINAQEQMDRRNEPGMRGGPGFMGRLDDTGRLFRMAERLELSKEQRDQIAGLMDKSRREMRDNTFKAMDARKELRELLQGEETVSDRKLRELTRVQGESMAEMMYLRVKLQSDIRGILTEDQLARFEEMRDRPGREFRHGERREMMRERFRERRG